MGCHNRPKLSLSGRPAYAPPHEAVWTLHQWLAYMRAGDENPPRNTFAGAPHAWNNTQDIGRIGRPERIGTAETPLSEYQSRLTGELTTQLQELSICRTRPSNKCERRHLQSGSDLDCMCAVEVLSSQGNVKRLGLGGYRNV